MTQNKRGARENATLPRAGGPLKVRGWCNRRRLGVALNMEPASTGSRPHMMHHDQDSSVTCRASNQAQRSKLRLMVRPKTSRVSLCPTRSPVLLGSRGFSLNRG